MKNKNLTKSSTMKYIIIDWLGGLYLNIIETQEQHQDVVERFDLQNTSFENDWHNSNGSYLCVGKEGVEFHFVMIANPERRVIIHESSHAALGILESKGIPISIDNTEVIAYMTDYISEELLKVLEKARKK